MSLRISLIVITALVATAMACTNPPLAEFDMSATEGQPPLEVVFSNLSANADAYRWDFGDGGTSAEADPTHTYTVAGTQVVSLTALKDGPITESVANATVHVEPGPLHTVTLESATVTLEVTHAQQFTATALDEFDNVIQGPVFACESTSDAGSVNTSGLFTAATTAGSYHGALTVAVTQGTINRSAAASVQLVPGPLDHVVVDPADVTMDIGATQTFDFTAFDEFENEIPDVTAFWSVSPDVGTVDGDGVFAAGTKAGLYEHAVIARVAQGTVTKSASAKLGIEPGPPVKITISPERVKMVPGEQLQFQASGVDAFGNTIHGVRYQWEANGAGSIDSQGLFTAGSVPGRYLKDITATVTESGTETVGAASVDVVFSGFATATIDGLFGPKEWDRATSLELTVNVPQGATAPAVLYVMNDDTNLYLAFSVKRDRLDRTSLFFEFDENRDDLGDAGFMLGSPNDSLDHFGGRLDVNLGGTNEGDGMVSNDGAITAYELSFPLDSDDDENDFSLNTGDFILFTLDLRLIGPGGEFPQDYGDTRFPPLGFMEIKVAG